MKFTSSLRYPVYYLDFETIGPSIPVFEGSKPYQQLVFQYSLHIQEISGSESITKNISQTLKKIQELNL